MSSLTAHLRQHADPHAGLPFHPTCPICRETRLAGIAPCDTLISPRARAALAAGVLALATGGPVGTALAQDGPQASSPGDSADSPAADPGGDSTDLPDGPQPPSDTAPATAGRETTPDPTADVADPVVDQGGGVPAAPATPSPVATAPATPPPVGATRPSPPPPAAPTPPVQSAPAPVPPRGAVAAATVRRVRGRHVGIVYVRRTHRHVRRVAQPVAVPTPETATVVSRVVRKPRPIAYIETRGVRVDGGTHVVRPGESLWSIADAALGGRATPAQIAREVHKLWTLNRARIGTGSPDLVMAGTKLVLP
jgi:LysM domain